MAETSWIRMETNKVSKLDVTLVTLWWRSDLTTSWWMKQDYRLQACRADCAQEQTGRRRTMGTTPTCRDRQGKMGNPKKYMDEYDKFKWIDILGNSKHFNSLIHACCCSFYVQQRTIMNCAEFLNYHYLATSMIIFGHIQNFTFTHPVFDPHMTGSHKKEVIPPSNVCTDRFSLVGPGEFIVRLVISSEKKKEPWGKNHLTNEREKKLDLLAYRHPGISAVTGFLIKSFLGGSSRVEAISENQTEMPSVPGLVSSFMHVSQPWVIFKCLCLVIEVLVLC